jgi:hypothetical protein
MERSPGDPERARRADGSEPWAPGPYAAFTLEPRGASLVGRGVPRGHIRLSFALAEWLASADLGTWEGLKMPNGPPWGPRILGQVL